LEIKSYTWVDRFEPDKAEVDPTSTPGNLPDADNDNKSDTSNTIKIVIGSIGRVLVLYLLRLWDVLVINGINITSKQIRQDAQNGILRIPSNNQRNISKFTK